MICVNEQCENNFNKCFMEYTAFSEQPLKLAPVPGTIGFRHWDSAMIEKMGNFQPSDIVADIGGGRSYLLPFLSSRIALGYIIDLGVTGKITTYRDWYKTYFCLDSFLDGKFVTLRVDARELPFKDDYLDKVITVSAFEHFDMECTNDPDGDIKAAIEVFRTLKPGGLFLGTVDFNPYTERPKGTTRAYTYNSFEKRIMEPAGFELYGGYKRYDFGQLNTDYIVQPLFFVLVKPLKGN